MTSTMTSRPRHTSSAATSSWRHPWLDEDAEVTAPLLLPSAHRAAPPAPGPQPRPRTALRTALVALALVLLAGTAGGAYLLGATSTSAATPADQAAGAPVDGGPELLEANGNPLDAAVADQVRLVYTALQRGDLGSIRVAYGAAGSDDGLDTEPHLRDAEVRAQLLAALRTHPIHDDHGYDYRAGAYGLEFNQAIGPLGAGLGRIIGPWSTTVASIPASSTPSTTPRASSSKTKTAPKTTAKAASKTSSASSYPYQPLGQVTRLPGESTASCVNRGGTNAECGVEKCGTPGETPAQRAEEAACRRRLGI
ncbi:hypothetical protein GCM10023201_15040 [Actinomycetospora corticicola]|uniref:Uncharacterized protein n=1 Tax=Actinomycetospora corticicola TaxID=663602 RepID=A0A7Y9DV75_9PSEU|nr:hypothetical protein [Actinomycetospora corticicola]NYD36138.1 hypothetical protein [Actinomycetospora corticicola]